MNSDPLTAEGLLSERSAGVLLHPTSLPGPFGCGDLGPAAYRFVDFLAEAGQAWWQVLPLGPPGPADSPYASTSAFAGSPLLVSPESLSDLGLLSASELDPTSPVSERRANFAVASERRLALLRRAFERLDAAGLGADVDRFAERTDWLSPFALFSAIRLEHGGPWNTWPPGLRARRDDDLEAIRARLAPEIRFHAFTQWAFDRQWQELRAYAGGRGVRVMGDIPIFVDLDSADTWWHREIFRLDEDGRPDVVAGVPPDYFSTTGQRWGNPHYRWDVLAERGYDWWVARMRRTSELVDAVRIDHFRGFAAAWEIPAENDAAIKGRWGTGPGRGPFDAFRESAGAPAVVAEDLGIVTPDVEELRDDLRLPGMLILQFAFDSDARNPYLPHNHRRAAIVYTGTHDNDTTLGWWSGLSKAARARVRAYLGRSDGNAVDHLVRAAYASVAAIAIVPMQDVLCLDSSARMNLPGRVHGNWNWRFSWDQIPAGRTGWLRDLAELYGRA